MELESGESIHVPVVTEAGIRSAFADDQSRGDFLILSEAEHTYIQIGGTGRGPFSLEYREGDDAHHFKCEREVSRAEAEAAFLKYFQHDPSWKTALGWKPLESKLRWKFWLEQM